MANNTHKINWLHKEEYWLGIHFFPGFQMSSYGHIRNLQGEPIELFYNDKNELCASFSYHDMTATTPLWRQMLHTFYEGRTEDVWFEYLDGDVGNLELDNLVPTYRTIDGDIKEIMWHGGALGTRILDRRRAKRERKVEIIQTGDVFDSVAECARAIGGYKNLVHKCLKGTAHSHMGYTFKYVEVSKSS